MPPNSSTASPEAGSGALASDAAEALSACLRASATAASVARAILSPSLLPGNAAAPSASAAKAKRAKATEPAHTANLSFMVRSFLPESVTLWYYPAQVSGALDAG